MKPEGQLTSPARRRQILVSGAKVLMHWPEFLQLTGLSLAYAEHSNAEGAKAGGVGGRGVAQVAFIQVVSLRCVALLGFAVHCPQLVLTAHGLDEAPVQNASVKKARRAVHTAAPGAAQTQGQV